MKHLPVSELARDNEPTHETKTVSTPQPVAERPAQHPRADLRDRHRQRPRSDARHLRRRSSARRRANLLGFSTPARRGPGSLGLTRHGQAVLGRGSPRRDQHQVGRAHGVGDRRVRRADAVVRGGLQPRSGPASHRCQPSARRACHRCVQDHARLRHHTLGSCARVRRGLDAGRRSHPREDGQRLAAAPHCSGSRTAEGSPRFPEGCRQAVQLRWLPWRTRRELRALGPQLPSPGWFHRRGDQ